MKARITFRSPDGGIGIIKGQVTEETNFSYTIEGRMRISKKDILPNGFEVLAEDEPKNDAVTGPVNN